MDLGQRRRSPHGRPSRRLERRGAKRASSLAFTLTMPHELASVVLLEQLYRATEIHRGTAYHRGRPQGEERT